MYSVGFLRSIRKRRYETGRPLCYKHFPAAVLCFVVQGNGTLLIDGEIVPLQPMQLYHLMPGMRVEASLSSESLDCYLLLTEHFVGAAHRKRKQLVLAKTASPYLPPGLVGLGGPSQLLERLEQLDEQYREGGDPARVHLQFQEMLYWIKLHALPQSDKRTAEQRIEQTIRYMQARYSEKIEMGALSAMVNLTASSFSRLFKKKTGETPLDYLTQLRIGQAKKLLARNDCLIKEVSSAVGYEDEFYFSRIFHRLVGVSPTIYMKRHRLRVAVASCLHLGDSLLTLGVEPVAAVNLCRIPGMDAEEHRLLFASQWAELEQAQPDLIITDKYHHPYHERLGELTRVVTIPPGSDWMAHYRKMAELVGRGEEAERTLGQLALRLTAVRRELQRSMRGKTVGIVQVSERGVTLHGTGDRPLNELLFRELGLKPGNHTSLYARSPELQPEWMPPLEADYVFVSKKHVRAGSDRVFERMSRTPAWKAMTAVRCNRIMLIPHWFRLSWTPDGRHTIMDELLDTMRASPEAERQPI